MVGQPTLYLIPTLGQWWKSDHKLTFSQKCWGLVGTGMASQHHNANLMPTFGQCWHSDHLMLFPKIGWQKFGILLAKKRQPKCWPNIAPTGWMLAQRHPNVDPTLGCWTNPRLVNDVVATLARLCRRRYMLLIVLYCNECCICCGLVGKCVCPHSRPQLSPYIRPFSRKLVVVQLDICRN